VPNQFESEIESEIEKNGTIFFKKFIPANFNLIRNIKVLNYFIHGSSGHENWIGTYSDKFSGINSHAENSMGLGRLRFYLIKRISNEDFLHLKSNLRDLFGLGNYSLHGADSLSETQDVMRTVCHPESLKCAKNPTSQATLKLAGWLKELDSAIKNNMAEKSEYCVGGSGPLGAYGARQISDLDLLSDKDQESLQSISFISFHKVGEVPYPSKLGEYIHDPEKFFYFLGFKFVSLKELLIMKQNRLEPKDVYDSRLIREIVGNRSWQNGLFTWTTNRLITMIYWGFRHRIKRTEASGKAFLVQYPRLTKALKKIRDKASFH
jgi:hypothetical protein